MANDKSHPEVERITLDEVLSQGPVPQVRELPPLTRIGYKLAVFLLLYLSVVTAVLLAEYFFHAPALPAGVSLDEGQLNQFRELSQIATDRTLKLLDALVLKGFLPVLTAVLGYIFGTRGADKEDV